VAGAHVTSASYDRIGRGYAERRRPDPRVGRFIVDGLADARSVVNVGAGTGSYEPRDRRVVAVEPSDVMLAQRPADAAPAVRARAEALPFRRASFDAGVGVLTIHHWTDWRAGLAELRRVAWRIVLLTWDPESDGLWLMRDYLPELLANDRRKFPSMAVLREALGAIDAVAVPIPHDCSDGFMGAYWRRPEAYLDPGVRAGISTFADGSADAGLARLADDLGSGAWARRHGALLELGELDLGYRVVVAR
jgi:SAM-dependent methyltransferase